MTFLTNLSVEPIKGSDYRRLLLPLVFELPKVYKYHYIVAPAGFLTDYASIPTIIPRWWLDGDDKYVREAAVIHDFIYSKDSFYALTREECDKIFLLGLKVLGCPWYKAYSAYAAVRLLGKSRYKT